MTPHCRRQTGSHFQLGGITCLSVLTCFAVGGLDGTCDGRYSAPEEAVIIKTQNGGRSWRQIFHRRIDRNKPLVIGAHLNAIACPTATICYAAGDGILARTSNSGRTWTVSRTALLLGTPGGPPPPPSGLACPSPTTCFAIASWDLTETADAGKHWRTVPTNRFGTLGTLTCPARDVCYAAGWPGLILKWIG
jgi:hypothetical protein